MVLPDGTRRRWIELIRRAGTAEEPAALGALEAILAAYETPPRHYHTIHHVVDCLARLDEQAELATSPDDVELAIWFHDLIYDAKRADNEEKSAWLAYAVCARLGVAEAASVRDLVLVTKHGATEPKGDEKLIVDIDLSILGSDAPAYGDYAAAIRREFAFVDDAAYGRGRRAFLRSLLERSRVFHLDPMRDRFEARARENMQRELALLDDSRAP